MESARLLLCLCDYLIRTEALLTPILCTTGKETKDETQNILINYNFPFNKQKILKTKHKIKIKQVGDEISITHLQYLTKELRTQIHEGQKQSSLKRQNKNHCTLEYVNVAGSRGVT